MKNLAGLVSPAILETRAQTDAALWGVLTLSFISSAAGLLAVAEVKFAASWAAMLVIFAVVVLTVSMKVTLDLTCDRRPWLIRLVALAAHLVLMLWSIGFGYAFYWSLLAAGAQTRGDLIAAEKTVRETGRLTDDRLSSARTAIMLATEYSNAQAERERLLGGTCGDGSSPGAGPRMAARAQLVTDLGAVTRALDTNGLRPVDAQLANATSAAGLLIDRAGQSGGEWRTRLQTHYWWRDHEIRRINDRIHKLQTTWVPRLDKLRETVLIRPGHDGFVCFDPVLARLLSAAVGELGRVPAVSSGMLRVHEDDGGARRALLDLVTALPAMAGDAIAMFTDGSAAKTGSGHLARLEWAAFLVAATLNLFILILVLIRPRDHAGHIWRNLSVAAAYKADVRKALQAFLRRDPDGIRTLFDKFVLRRGGTLFLAVPDWEQEQEPEIIRERNAVESLQLALEVAQVASPLRLSPHGRLYRDLMDRLRARYPDTLTPCQLTVSRLKSMALFQMLRLVEQDGDDFHTEGLHDKSSLHEGTHCDADRTGDGVPFSATSPAAPPSRPCEDNMITVVDAGPALGEKTPAQSFDPEIGRKFWAGYSDQEFWPIRIKNDLFSDRCMDLSNQWGVLPKLKRGEQGRIRAVWFSHSGASF